MNYDYACIMSTEAGPVVKLTMNDLRLAYREYRFLTTRNYILENYPDATDKVDEIAKRAIELEDNYHYREDDAIEQAFDEIM